MSEGDALLADILANPDDDVPRLIYADWLTDHGEPERSHWIRAGIAWRMPIHGSPWHETPWDGSRRIVPALTDLAMPADGSRFVWHRGFVVEVHARFEELRDRLSTLVRQHPIERVEATDHHPWPDTDGTGLYIWWEIRQDRADRRQEYEPPVLEAGELPDEVFQALWQAAPVPDRRQDSVGRWVRFASQRDALDGLSAVLLKLARGEA